MRCVCLAAVALALSAPASASATLVYGRPPANPTAAMRNGTIVVARDDGSAPRPVARGIDPVVSPDGRAVAYFSIDRHDHQRLRLISIGGGRVRSLAPSAYAPTSDSWPFAWSPNSRYLLVEGSGQTVLIVDVRHRTRRTLRLEQSFTGGNFSPRSSMAVIGRLDASSSSATQSVISLRVAGRQRTIVTHDGARPVWGRGGIAFTRPLPSPSQLLIARRPGLAPRTVFQTSDPILFPVAWSRDGRTLLAGEGHDPSTLQGLLINPTSGSVTTLPQTFSAIEALSRDGRHVLGEAAGNVVSVSADGTETVLARNATVPSWTR